MRIPTKIFKERAKGVKVIVPIIPIATISTACQRRALFPAHAGLRLFVVSHPNLAIRHTATAISRPTMQMQISIESNILSIHRSLSVIFGFL